MKTISIKKIALLCGIVFALCGMVLAMHGVSTAYAEVPQAQITLDAGQGTYDGSNNTKTVNLQNGTLPTDVVPTREGWTFIGWFDQEVVENFWGDVADENPEVDDYKVLKATYGGYNYILYDGQAVAVSELDDSVWKELTFNWICATMGNQVVGDTVSDGSTLYAMYTPECYTVYWHLNGWKNTYDSDTNTAHKTMPQHNGYFVEYELDKFSSLSWNNHTFEGWYTEPECTTEYKFHQVGAYKINQTEVTQDLHLYAKWSSSATFDGEIRTSKLLNLVEPALNSTFTVNCSYLLGASKDKPVISKWESSEPSAVAFVSNDVSTLSAVFAIQDTTIFNDGNVHVYIYVTVDGVDYVAADITIGHTWGGVVSQKLPTCTEKGHTVYGCKFCAQTKTVEYAASGHRIVTNNTPATCTEDGVTTTVCVVCNQTVDKTTIPALSHNVSVWTYVGCGGVEITTEKCSRCDYTNVIGDVELAKHDWNSDYTIDKQADCVSVGVMSIHCLKCDEVKDVTTIPVDTNAHVWSDWTIASEPTSTQEGVTVRHCEICAKEESQTIPTIPSEEDTESETVYPAEEEQKPETTIPDLQTEEEYPHLTVNPATKSANKQVGSQEITSEQASPKQSDTTTLLSERDVADKTSSDNAKYTWLWIAAAAVASVSVATLLFAKRRKNS